MPVTPTQMAGACVEAAMAGASVVHIHVRDPKTAANSRSPELFKEVVDRVRSSGQDVVINLTCGHGAFFLPDSEDESRGAADSDVVSAWERMRHLEQCLSEIASLDITTGNQVEGAQEFVYLNTTRTLRAMAQRYRDLGIKPELETFGAGRHPRRQRPGRAGRRPVPVPRRLRHERSVGRSCSHDHRKCRQGRGIAR
jgi:uncharacterized protein (DUF849 family)